jgi:hypothetical protein
MIDSRFTDLTAHLWRGGQYAYFWTPNDGTGQKTSYWLTVGGDTTVPKWLEGLDAYFSVNPANIRRSEHERARIIGSFDIAAINCLYTEFDGTDRAELDAFLAKLLTFGVKAACIIFSGGGYHVYVLLRAPFILDSADKQKRAADLQWAFVEWAGGDDGVKDLTRVLRIPGTINHKQRYAPNFPTVAVELWDIAAQYEIADLEPFLQPLIDQRDAAKAHTPTPAQTVSLSDADLLAVLFGSKNGVVYQELWAGNLSAANGDHSKADQMLCNGLAWLTGRDISRMDSLFRLSGLYRKKWDRQVYRESTLNNAAGSAQTVYDPSRNGHIDPQAVAAAQAAVGMNGGNGGTKKVVPPGTSGGTSGGNGGSQPQPPSGGKYNPPNSPLTADYLNALHSLGFYFRLNLLDDHIEVNAERLDDLKIRIIKNRIRDLGFKSGQIPAMEDAYWEEAGSNAYHPIKDYLQSLTWDGDDHIRLLSRYFKDRHDPVVYSDGTSETVFYVWLKRWLIAAVAKVYSGNTVNAQNAVLVLEGGQNLGKSTFARWLCSGVPNYFIEKSIEPDSKEDERRLAANWIWEIGELGATTRKADREALKGFLTREKCTFRNPYAKEDSNKPALASFVGTVNNEGGFLQDATGSRRFMTVGLLDIQHAYIDDIDIDQLWAQAFELYRVGEPWRLTPEETIEREEVNKDYKVEDPYEGWILRYFDIDPARAVSKTAGWFVTTQELVSELKQQGVTDSTTAISMRLSTTMKSMGLERARQHKRTGAWGYWGLKIKP